MEHRFVNPQSILELQGKEPVFKTIYTEFGSPPAWERPQGFASLCKIILEQQVSLASAKAHFEKLKAYVGDFQPELILRLSDEEMRNCHISRQKTKYIKEVAKTVVEGRLVFEELPKLPETEIREKLTSIKGIGQWTADMYLLFCLQSPDILPLGDLAIVNAMKELWNVTEKDTMYELAEKWRPLRSLGTFSLWHYYLQKRNRKDDLS